ncbi:MAG: helix-turn-helix domain-containing protein [Gammaproteobacteria bacterium]|nr:helix-turn-helix domain-containing protein [Gammaproteobacteria bacterium]
MALKIAKNLKKYRLKNNLSQMELAERAGMHFTYYSQIERALRKDMSVRRLKNIADALGVTLNDIVY